MPWVIHRDEATASEWPGDKDTVCVSITEGLAPDVSLQPGFAAVLRLRFGDWDTDRFPRMKLHAIYREVFTPALADRLAAFLLEHRGRNMLIHCSAGVSRSGAVVDVVLQAFPEYEDRGGHRMRHPNNLVRRLLKRAMGLVPIGATAGE